MAKDNSVYVLIGVLYYEGTTVYGTFDSKEKATKSMEELSTNKGLFVNELVLLEFKVNQIDFDDPDNSGKVVKKIAVKPWHDE